MRAMAPLSSQASAPRALLAKTGRRGSLVKAQARPARGQSATATDMDWSTLAADMDGASPIEIMDHALATFGDEIAIAFSGAEDVAVIEYAKMTGRPFRVFSLDTGRLEKGMFSFYEDGHQECCRVRKVRPLRRQLKTLKAWITGQWKDQSPGTRAEVPVVQVDPVFEGLAGGEGSLIKYNPLSNAMSADVWMLLRTQGVPTNALHAQGYDLIKYN